MTITVTEHEETMMEIIGLIDKGWLRLAPDTRLTTEQVRHALYYGVACINAQRETNRQLAARVGQPFKGDERDQAIAELQKKLNALHWQIKDSAAKADKAEEVLSKVCRRLTIEEDISEALRKKIRRLSGGVAMRALAEEVQSLRSANADLRKRLNDAEAGERLRDKRSAKDHRNAEPAVAVEGVTWGHPSRSRIEIGDGCYRVDWRKGAA